MAYKNNVVKDRESMGVQPLVNSRPDIMDRVETSMCAVSQPPLTNPDDTDAKRSALPESPDKEHPRMNAEKPWKPKGRR